MKTLTDTQLKGAMSKHTQRVDKRSRDFTKLCEEALATGGVVKIVTELHGTVNVEVVLISFVPVRNKESLPKSAQILAPLGFEAKCPTNILDSAYVELIRLRIAQAEERECREKIEAELYRQNERMRNELAKRK